MRSKQVAPIRVSPATDRLVREHAEQIRAKTGVRVPLASIADAAIALGLSQLPMAIDTARKPKD